MTSHSVKTFRDSWQAYVGAFVALVGGVALIGLTVNLVGAIDVTGRADGTTQADRAHLDDLAALFGMMAGISLFLAIFVVSSTFGFVVATRRRELGLLRLIGATPRQTRRLLLGEATVVAVIASAVGGLAATAVTPVAFAVLKTTGLATLDLQSPPPWLAWAIGGGCGISVAVVGAWRSSRRAGRTSPTEALHESTIERRWPGIWRIIVAATALAALVGTIAVVVAGDLSPIFAILIAMFLPMALAVGLVSVGGVVFPALAGLIGRPFARRSTAARLGRDHARSAVRLPAALAAPVVAISAIAGSMVFALSMTADWTEALDREQLRAPLVVEGAPDGMAEISAVDIADVRQHARARVGSDRDEVEVVDVAAASAARGLRAVDGDLDDLHGKALAVTETYVSDMGTGVGRTRTVTLDGTTMRLPIVAVVRDAPDLYRDLIVPTDLAGPVAQPDGTTFVVTSPDADTADVRAALSEHGTVVSGDAWIEAIVDESRTMNNLVLMIIMGPGGIYAAIGIVNAILIGIGQRRRQLRTAQLVGATPEQVRRMAIWEVGLIGAAGLLVGAVITTFVGWLLRTAILRDVSDAAITMPWLPLTVIAVTCAALVGVAGVVGARAATRSPTTTPGRVRAGASALGTS